VINNSPTSISMKRANLRQ